MHRVQVLRCGGFTIGWGAGGGGKQHHYLFPTHHPIVMVVAWALWF